MTSTLYSAEEVATVLGLHVRTIRNYVRDGRLPAVRIGKQYRIAEEDLREFTGGHAGQPARRESAPRSDVSAIVQIDAIGRRAMDRITAHVTGAVAGSGQRPGLHVQSIYDEDREVLKIILVGSADAAATMIALIDTLVEGE